MISINSSNPYTNSGFLPQIQKMAKKTPKIMLLPNPVDEMPPFVCHNHSLVDVVEESQSFTDI